MKKYFYILTAIFLMCAGNMFAQAPTFNFEDWNTFPETPKGWFTSTYLSPALKPVSRTTDKNSGTYAMKLETKVSAQGDTTAGMAVTGEFDFSAGSKLGFPMNKRPKTVSFFYKYTPDASGDSMIFTVFLSKFDTATKEKKYIGAANFTKSSTVAAYTKQDLVIIYDTTTSDMPDSAMVFIMNTDSENPKIGSVLFVDDITFDTSITTSILNSPVAQSIRINAYPNPAQDNTYFSFELNQSEKVTIKVYDILGKEVATIMNESKNAGSHVIPYNASALNNGIYIYRITAGSAASSGKLTINR